MSNLKYYVRPDQIPGKVVIIDFADDDLHIDSSDDTDPEDLIHTLMAALVQRVKDAERVKACAVIIVFDFHDAEPFQLEDTDGDGSTIPAVMVSKSDGDRIKACLDEKGDGFIRIFRRADTVMR